MSSSSNLTSQGMFLATAMAAVSGTAVVLLTFRLQKSTTTQFSVNPIPHQSPEALPRSCISLDGKKREKKKKRVHFAEDVVDPTGNSEEYRKMYRNNFNGNKASDYSNSSTMKKAEKVQEMPANRLALYNGILRDRVHHRVGYSC